MDEKKKREIIEFVFGDDGLQPALIKMFLDPLHQHEVGGAYNHETATKNMRYSVIRGLELIRNREEEIGIISTLYAPRLTPQKEW